MLPFNRIDASSHTVQVDPSTVGLHLWPPEPMEGVPEPPAATSLFWSRAVSPAPATSPATAAAAAASLSAAAAGVGVDGQELDQEHQEPLSGAAAAARVDTYEAMESPGQQQVAAVDGSQEEGPATTDEAGVVMAAGAAGGLAESARGLLSEPGHSRRMAPFPSPMWLSPQLLGYPGSRTLATERRDGKAVYSRMRLLAELARMLPPGGSRSGGSSVGHESFRAAVKVQVKVPQEAAAAAANARGGLAYAAVAAAGGGGACCPGVTMVLVEEGGGELCEHGNGHLRLQKLGDLLKPFADWRMFATELVRTQEVFP